jgi:hypothetical protein
MTTLQIESHALAEFLQLPSDVRREVEKWDRELQAVTRPIQRNLEKIANRLGVSLKTARRRYDAWRREGWRGLINRSKVPEDRGLDSQFIEWWKKLCQENGRKCRPAYREFVRRFKDGTAIPGLPPGMPRNALPLGFTYCNLIRYKPTRFELTAARIGRGAAADFRPKLFTTRNGLHVGERMLFDDMWHDFKVVMVGQRRAMRLLQLHAHDVFSGCQFARGIKPRIEAPDGTSVGLKENEMLFLVAHVLTEFGYYPDGCVLMVEHGTAAIREDLEKVLFDLTAGKVLVDRSGIEGASAFAGQYAGRSKGNFRFKAALESLGNLIHNETANLLAFPGQTGSNSRLNLPEEMAGRDRHADALIRAMAALPAARVGQLRLPYLEVNQAKWLVEEITERINQRTDHELEGWLEAGLTTMDFDVPGVGLLTGAKVLALPDEKRAAVLAVAQPLARKLSPREVFDDGQRTLVRFRPEQTAMLLKERVAREVKVGNDHLIEFDDQDISPSPLRYKAHTFAPGEKFELVVNPLSPQVAHLFDAAGRWVGVVDTWQTISQTDTAGLHRQMGEAAKIESQLLAPVAARGAEITRQRLAAAQHNAGVLTSDARKLRKFKGGMEELASSAAEAMEDREPAEAGTTNQDDFSAEALL